MMLTPKNNKQMGAFLAMLKPFVNDATLGVLANLLQNNIKEKLDGDVLIITEDQNGELIAAVQKDNKMIKIQSAEDFIKETFKELLKNHNYGSN